MGEQREACNNYRSKTMLFRGRCHPVPHDRRLKYRLLPFRRPTNERRCFVTTLTKLVLYTERDGRAQFREEQVPLASGTPQSMLSVAFPSSGYQLRYSPIGYRSQFHCTPRPQWVFVLEGEMEIGLQDGSSRVLKPGGHCYAADSLPPGATFDSKVHGHWSAQRGADALVTLFVW